MKLPLKIIGIFLIFALLTSCVAATEPKDLPTKEEITDFIASIPVSDNYINTVFDAVKDEQPTWNCDTWEDKNGNQMLSLYYVDPDSSKGFDSIYFNELGEEISMRGVEVDLVNKYIGKAVSDESKEDVKETEDEEENDSTTEPENIQTGAVNNYDTTIVNTYDNSQTNTQTTTVNNYYSKEPENTQEEPENTQEEPENTQEESENTPEETEETSADHSEKSSASVDLHGEKTSVLKGEDILLKLSAVNFITKPTMHVQAIIIPPSGMSVSSSEFVESGAGQYTTTYDIEPGKGRDIEVRIAANQVGDFTVTGKVVYYFGNNKEDGEYYTLDLPIHVEDSTPETPISEDKSVTIPIPDTPGFGAASLVMILIMVFLLRKE
ncbi:hypothetical protein [Methanosarcina vacuolata]|uniref:RNA-binding proteins (RRM domain) n=1 Tax=Methanosarcina vacuolata Z-761 TaxID=1434123 RepID=A0A0E3LHH5_9EURY|nr:hypothetical protein [Methanosarcina vacuolata]AKB44281.1 RNA-binding proteins (RRM domain) [Methanosarcina vacuolata Z-761]